VTYTENDIRVIPVLIGQLFQIVQALNKACPNRPFTPDGHLVGSIGEVVAAETYGLDLEKCSNEGFDARTRSTNQTVEIKLTGGNGVAVSSDSRTSELLIVLKFHPETGFEEIYNGDFPIGLWREKKANKRRVVSLRLNELRKENPKLLKQEYPLEQLNKLFITVSS
jgi:hypothetical protein